jgi:hypothetical protein
LRLSPQVSKIKALLLRDGYVMISGGINRIRLTPKGRAYHDKMWRIVRLKIEEALCGCSLADVEALTGFLGQALTKRKPPASEGARKTASTENRTGGGTNIAANEA